MQNSEFTELINKITRSLDILRPHLQADGGDIEVIEITDDFIIKVRLLGTCNTCPRSINAVKGGITEYFKSAFPEIKEVVAIRS